MGYFSGPTHPERNLVGFELLMLFVLEDCKHVLSATVSTAWCDLRIFAPQLILTTHRHKSCRCSLLLGSPFKRWCKSGRTIPRQKQVLNYDFTPSNELVLDFDIEINNDEKFIQQPVRIMLIL
jgi:hypothetical protein